MKFILDQEQLLEVQMKSSIKIIDVRPFECYQESHIENSISIPEIFSYLPTGLTSKDEKNTFDNFFKNKLSINGITREDIIVFYEEKYTIKSPRGITILKYLGHDEDKLFVLEGGIEFWKQNNLKTTNIVPAIVPTIYKVDRFSEFFLDYNEMLEAVYDEKIIKLDVRDKDEWAGISSSPYGLDYAPKKGRLPNSIWIEWYEFISDELFKVQNVSNIKNELETKNVKVDDDIVIYCFKGARVSNTYIALRALGYEKLRFYFAGWNEWCRIDGAPYINEVDESDNLLLKENILMKKRLEEVCVLNSKLINFPKNNTEPVFAFNREGNVFNDNNAKKIILPSLNKLSDLIQDIDDDFIHNFIDNNYSQTVVRKEAENYYEIKLKGSREVNAILAFGFNITELKNLTQNLEKIVAEKTESLEKKTKYIEDNIKYSALIQESILPKDSIFKNTFKEYFIHWKPCDIVGGDIYFANTFGKNDEEVLIMLLDGAGHSISGSLLTMLLKAIETKIIANVLSGKLNPEPNLILEKLNTYFKVMTNQSKNTKALIGFDGGVLYYNTSTRVCKYSGAKTPLYVFNDNKLKIIKSDRISLGYPRNKIDQTFTQYDVTVKSDTVIYFATDGIIDQENDEGVFFGKSKFKEFLIRNHQNPLCEQKEALKKEISDYANETVQTDDISIVSVKLN